MSLTTIKPPFAHPFKKSYLPSKEGPASSLEPPGFGFASRGSGADSGVGQEDSGIPLLMGEGRGQRRGQTPPGDGFYWTLGLAKIV